MRNLIVLVMVGLVVVSTNAQETGNTQIPAIVTNQLSVFQDKFQTVLDEECPQNLCYSVGCEITGFQTLDDQPLSSLPGLEEGEEPVKTLQYKLNSVKCEFAVEPAVSTEALASLRNRLNGRVKQSGVNLNLISRRLSARSDVLKTSETSLLDPKTMTTSEGWAKVMPWLMLGLYILLGTIALIWAFRRVGKDRPVEYLKEEVAAANADEKANEPSAMMILARANQLKEKLQGNTALAQETVRTLLKQRDIDTLCLFLRHFGADSVSPFTSKPEFEPVLVELRTAYENFSREEEAQQIWNFLDKIERLLVSSEIQVASKPMEEAFSFLHGLSEQEFVELLNRVDSEQDRNTFLLYAPTHLRSHFFASKTSQDLHTLLMFIKNTPRVSDKQLRDTAARVKNIYENQKEDIRLVQSQQSEVLEELLLTLPGRRRKEFLRELRQTQPTVAQALLQNVLLEDALVYMSPDLLSELFFSVSPETAAAYLNSMDNGEAVLLKLKKPLAASIAKHMKQNRGKVSFVNQLSKGVDFVGDQNQPESQQAKEARLKVGAAMRRFTQQNQVDVRGLNETALAQS